MGKQFSKDIEKLQLEMEYRNYSSSSVRNYCVTMSAMEKRLGKALSSITTEEFKIYLHDLIFNQIMSLRFLKENLDKCVEILNKAVFLPMLEGLNALEVVSFTLNKDMTACKKCKKGRMRAKHKIIASPT